MRIPKLLLSAGLLACVGPSLGAQAAPAQPLSTRYQISGGYAFFSNSFNGHSTGASNQPLNGWDAAFAAPVWRSLAVKVDAGGFYGTSLTSPQHPIFLLGGVQASHGVGRESVFIEGLAGFGHLNSNWWGGEFPGHTTSFTAVAGGGLDTPLAAHVSLRIQGDFQYANFTVPDDQVHSLPNYFARIATGLVWKF